MKNCAAPAVTGVSALLGTLVFREIVFLGIKFMGPISTVLCQRLRETSTLLRRAGESHWAKWMDESLRRIENSDLAGVDHLLNAYGGMGSFNDLILMAANGHTVSDVDQHALNDRLATLRSELWELARELRRIAEIAE